MNMASKPAYPWPGIIRRYADLLPVTAETPVVTLLEGNTPLIPAPALVAAMGGKFELFLKYEALNPTCSFKDRGMTLAITKAKERGAKVVVCASTGNTSASAAAYAARAGMKCVVLLPKGKIALGKLAQALLYGATTVSIEGNFDDALRVVRELGETGLVEVVNSINPVRIEGQKTAAFEICDVLGDAPDFHFLPVGNAGNITAYWKGFREYAEAGRSDTLPRMMGWQAAGAAPPRPWPSRRAPRDRRHRHPHREPRLMAGRRGRRPGLERLDPVRDRRRDPARVQAVGPDRGRDGGTRVRRAHRGPDQGGRRRRNPRREPCHGHHDRPWAQGPGQRPQGRRVRAYPLRGLARGRPRGHRDVRRRARSARPGHRLLMRDSGRVPGNMGGVMIVFPSPPMPGLAMPWIARWVPVVAILAGLDAAPRAVAQGSSADYERAMGLAQRTENKVFRSRIHPEWFNPSNFWYRVETGPGTAEFVRVNATTGERAPLMDIGRVRESVGKLAGKAPGAGESPEGIRLDADGSRVRFRLSGKRWSLRMDSGVVEADEQPEAPLPARQGNRVPRRSRRTGEETSITFVNQTKEDAELFWLDTEGQRRSYGRIRPGQERTQHTFEGHAWLLVDKLGNTLAVFEADATGRRAVIEEGGTRPPRQQEPQPEKTSAPARPPERGQSPDGRWVAFVKENNLHLRSVADGTVAALSRDGDARQAYSADVTWAPDSSAVVARSVRKGGERTVHFVEAAPKDQLQPKLHQQRYLKPGDELPKPLLRVFTLPGRRQWDVADALYANPFTESGDIEVRWSADGRGDSSRSIDLLNLT